MYVALVFTRIDGGAEVGVTWQFHYPVLGFRLFMSYMTMTKDFQTSRQMFSPSLILDLILV